VTVVFRDSWRVVVPAGAFLLLAIVSRAGEDAMPRRELAPFERALESAVSRVSRPVSQSPLAGGADTVRGYRLPGFGALFVVSARFIPKRTAARTHEESALAKADRELARAIGELEAELKTATSEEQKGSLNASIVRMKDRRRELRERVEMQQQFERDVQVFYSQVLDMSRQAEEAWQEAELHRRSIQKRLGPMPPREARTVSDGASGASGEPARPAEGASEPAPPPARSAHARPPWHAWFQMTTTTVAERRPPEQVMADVRQAILDVLESQGSALESLDPQEVVAVAVDFTTGVPGTSTPPARTLVVRAPKAVLDSLRAGTLSAEDARKQFQIAEY
jgi:hypothetical protein